MRAMNESIQHRMVNLEIISQRNMEKIFRDEFDEWVREYR